MGFEFPGSWSIQDRSLVPSDFVSLGMAAPTFDAQGRVAQIVEHGVNGEGLPVSLTSTFAYPNAATTVITTLELDPCGTTTTTVTTITQDANGIPTVTIS